MRKQTQKADVRDYLAVALIGAGSSYARGPDLNDCATRLGRIIVSDWGSLYDVAGKPCDVNLFDVTGHDAVYWDARGVFGNNDEPIERLELRKITLPKKRP